MNSVTEMKELLLSAIFQADEAYQANDYALAGLKFKEALKEVKQLLPLLDNHSDSQEFEELAQYLSARAKLMTDMADSSNVDVIIKEETNISFDSFVGLTSLKEYLRQDIIEPWKSHTLHQRKKHGLFLYGPKGVSKTTFANALLHELHATGYFIQPFHYFNLSDCPAMENQMRRIFLDAEKKDNAVFFLEQPAPFFPKGEDINSQDTAELFLRIFSSEMKRVKAKKLNILLLATTSVPDKITEKAFTPNLFDDFIHIDVPDEETRRVLIHKYLKDLPVQEENIVLFTKGMVTTDISRLCRTLALKGEENKSLSQADIDNVCSSFHPVARQGFDDHVDAFERNIAKFEIIHS